MAKSVVRTVRIDEEMNEAIEKLALEQRTSVNFVVNRALREHVEWTSVVPKLGFGTYPHYLTVKLLEKLTESECEGIGRTLAFEFLKPFVEYRFGLVSLDNWMRIIRDFSEYTGQFQFLVERRGGQLIAIIEHGSGMKYSRFLAGAARYIYGESLGRKPDIEITENRCTVKIE